jgi:hypothetical protein
MCSRHLPQDYANAVYPSATAGIGMGVQSVQVRNIRVFPSAWPIFGRGRLDFGSGAVWGGDTDDTAAAGDAE